ncbi:MAG: patatin-like phospholipase family protein [Bryobacteraceae bacterium]|nr:patatin-like phospholipase family protein [Bryobacteraceae bacterium]
MAKTVRILSIDGGGIRGIIPATLLAALEKRSGKPIAESFDLIAGTSTGGILALALAKPGAAGKPEYTAEQIIDLYFKEGSKIFPDLFFHKLSDLFEEKYPSSGIEGVLDSYFGGAMLSEALTNVLVTSYEIERRMPFFFRSIRAKADAAYNFPMKRVARATSAAPTYFEPLKLETPAGDDYYGLIDGGVFANNPAMCAYVDARRMFPDATDYLIVSVGTGSLIKRLPVEDAQRWGLVKWARPILDIMFDGVSATVDHQMRELFPTEAGVKRYYRFQIDLQPQNEDMDNTAPENLRSLKLLGEQLVRNCGDELNDIAARLKGLAAAAP